MQMKAKCLRGIVVTSFSWLLVELHVSMVVVCVRARSICDQFLQFRFTGIIRQSAHRLSFVSPIIASADVKCLFNLLSFGINQWYFIISCNENTPWIFYINRFYIGAVRLESAFLHRIHPTDSTTLNNTTHWPPKSSIVLSLARSLLSLFLSSLPTRFVFP